jgi:transcriptional regulator CtsR
MAKISDIIEVMIKQMMAQNNGSVEISRSELADRVNCVPSQITYVLATRFTNGQGYLVESRRGGGGWIRIRQVTMESPTRFLMHTLNSLGSQLSQHQAEIIIRNFQDYEVVPEITARLLLAATSDWPLKEIDADKRDQVRMCIFKNMLTSLLVRRQEEGKP